MTDVLRLSSLQRGETGHVDHIEGNDAISARIMEMGIIDGEEITMIGAAPLGDPLEFQVQGYRISLRIKEADRVILKQNKPASDS